MFVGACVIAVFSFNSVFFFLFHYSSREPLDHALSLLLLNCHCFQNLDNNVVVRIISPPMMLFFYV